MAPDHFSANYGTCLFPPELSTSNNASNVHEKTGELRYVINITELDEVDLIYLLI